MALSSYLLLLLVALSVSAVHKGLKEPDEVLSPDAEDETLGGCLPQGKNHSVEFPLSSGRSGKERHSLYHTYSNHSNNWIRKATVQFDGVEIYCFILKRTGHWTYSPWNITMKDVDYTFRNYSKDFYHHLKDTDSDLTQRYGCEVERSSSGDVTLLSTTAEFRLNGKIILRFNVDRDEWEALDKRFLAVKTEWNSLTHFNQTIKDYLQQGCTDRLRSYLKLYDEDIRNRTATVFPIDTHMQNNENEGKEGIVLFSVLSFVMIACVAAAMAFALLMKKMGRKRCEEVVKVVKHAYRGFSNVMMSDDQDGGDAVQTQKNISSSREFLPPYMESFSSSREFLPPSMGRFSSSMDNLPPVMKRSTASMHQPPDLAEDDDGGQKLTQVRLAQTAGLTTAGGRLCSTSISLPVFGSWNSRAIWV